MTIHLPKYIGHRGLAAFAPENTLSSIQKAHEKGHTMVEFDVKECEDGVLILMHDDTLNRTTNTLGDVASCSWESLSNVFANKKFETEFPLAKIPKLDEVFQLLSELNLNANIEIKPSQGREEQTALKICTFINHNWPKNLPSPIVSSFSKESLIVASGYQTNFHLGCLYDQFPDDGFEFAQKIKAKLIHMNYKNLDKKLAQEIKNKNYYLLCYTINDKYIAEKLFQMGVDSVFTDSLLP